MPTDHLQSVLKKMPRAVMLTPEQYDALLRDAQRAIPNPDAEEKPEPPVKAVIREADYSGTITTGGDVVTMVADYVVESFADDWAEIPLSLPRTRLAHIEVDEKSALRVVPPAKGKSPQPILVVQGKGRHTVRATFHLPVKRSPTGNSIVVASPGTASASLKMTLPDGAELDSALPFTTGESDPNIANFVLPAQAGQSFEIRWTARNVAEIPDAAIFQTCQYLYSIDSTRVQADLGFVLNSSLTKLPNRYEIAMDESVRVLSVEGSELLRWTRLGGGNIEVVLVAGDRDVADLRILAEADVAIPEDAEDGTIALPIADVQGIHRASGTMALIGSDDVRVKNITTGPLTAPIPDDIEGAIANHPFYVAAFEFPVATRAPEITLSTIGEKFKAQLDTLVALERESTQFTRTLTILPDEGRTFEIEFSLPLGEELLDVKGAGARSDFSWTRADGNTVRLSWKTGLSKNAGDTLTVTSRRDPEGWFALDESAMSLSFSSASIAGVEALSGYVAVQFDESFRVETVTAEGLDSRDGRTTPVTGTLAWFRLSDYNLELNVSRRATEIEAAHTAYALPLSSSLEIEGQFDLDIRYTPIGEIVIEFPPAVSEQVRFDSPLIAEKNVDADTGAWTLVFHDELIGGQTIRYRMSLPFEVEEVAEDSEQKRFEIALPVAKVPAAKRLRGDWVIEANTDTELNFEANGLDAVDSLRVPIIHGYRPRHRVIAAYRYRGDAWSLKLAGTRHAHEELVSTVIDWLRIDTVVSTDGQDRHQAAMSLRTTGEQFLEIGLPKDAVLWTLTVDGAAVKPVRAQPGTLRVQLPAHENSGARPVSLKLIYQTPGRKWRGAGREKLQPIRVADRIPVMRTQWLLHLPEGYDYQKFETNLREEFEVVDRTLLGHAGDKTGEFLSRLEPPRILMAVTDSAASMEQAEFEGQMAADEVTKNAPEMPVAPNAAPPQALAGRPTMPNKPDPLEVPPSDAQLFGANRETAKGGKADQPNLEGLVTRKYRVPPGFMLNGGDGGGGGGAGGAPPADPFADPAPGAVAGGLQSRKTARQILEENAGIHFGTNGGAAFNAETGELIVRTTPDQAERLDQFTQSLSVAGPGPGESAGKENPSGEMQGPMQTAQIGNTTADYFGERVIDQVNPNWRDVPVLGDLPVIGNLFQKDEQVAQANGDALKNITIDELNLEGKTVREALDLIREKTLAEGATVSGGGTHPSVVSRSKLVKFKYREPESGVDPTEKNKLDLKLSNVTVSEALDEIAKATGTHYRVTASGVVIAPKEIPVEPMQTIFIELPESEFQTSDGNGGILPIHARNVLQKAGIEFPPGSSAAYNRTSGRLAVRNTRENLEAIASLYGAFLDPAARQARAQERAEIFERQFLGGAANLRGFDFRDIGRLPIDFALPESGRSYSFSGLYAPAEISFRFVNWERQIRFAWIWILAGGLAFWFGAFRKWGRPVFYGLIGVIVLTFVPLVISESLLAFCNALLIGWLVAAAIWIAWKWAGMVSGNGKEASAV
ncbi:MAG: hypothetical protein HKN23_14400 [Verrucomicrobiales bacterium]|nr:hypothetical protein [Verrucomicrobiales bacterium]